MSIELVGSRSSRLIDSSIDHSSIHSGELMEMHVYNASNASQDVNHSVTEETGRASGPGETLFVHSQTLSTSRFDWL